MTVDEMRALDENGRFESLEPSLILSFDEMERERAQGEGQGEETIEGFLEGNKEALKMEHGVSSEEEWERLKAEAIRQSRELERLEGERRRERGVSGFATVRQEVEELFRMASEESRTRMAPAARKAAAFLSSHPGATFHQKRYMLSLICSHR